MSYKDQDVDFIEIFDFLWQGKWKILLSIITFLIFGIIKLNFEDEVYESRISFSINIIPPSSFNFVYYDESMVLNDVKKLFYSEDFFNEWRQNKNSNISFDNIKVTKEINGIQFKSENSNLIELKLNPSKKSNKISSTLIIYTNDFFTIYEFQDYLLKINEKLKDEYLLKVEKEINEFNQLLKKYFYENIESNNNLNAKLLPLFKFQSLLNESIDIISIEPPTIPFKVSPNIIKYIVTYLLIGIFFGVAFILLLSFIKSYRDSKRSN